MLCKPSSILENKPNPHWDTGHLIREGNLTTHQKSQKRRKKEHNKTIFCPGKEQGDRTNKEFPLPFQLFTLQPSVTLRSAELSKHVSVPTVQGFSLPAQHEQSALLKPFKATLTQTDLGGCEKSSREVKRTTCRRSKCGDDSKLKPMEIIWKPAQWDAGIKPFPVSTKQPSCRTLITDSFQGQLSPDLSPKCCMPLTKA